MTAILENVQRLLSLSNTWSGSQNFTGGINAGGNSIFAPYRTILTVEGSETGASASTRSFPSNGGSPLVPASGTTNAVQFIYLDPADFPDMGSLTAKLRIRAQLLVNNTAPARTFTFGLYPITAPAGGAGTMTWTMGTVVTGSNGATVASPAANSINNLVGSDFSMPAAGLYAPGVVYSGALAASSFITMNVQLQMRYT
jgi:hypothetical protein